MKVLDNRYKCLECDLEDEELDSCACAGAHTVEQVKCINCGEYQDKQESTNDGYLDYICNTCFEGRKQEGKDIENTNKMLNFNR